MCLRYGIPLAGTYFETLFPCLCNALLPVKSSQSRRVQLGSLLILESFCRKISNWSGASLHSIVSIATVSLEQDSNLNIASCALHVLASFLENSDEEQDVKMKKSVTKTLKKYIQSSKIWKKITSTTTRSEFVKRNILHNIYGVVRVSIAVEHDDALLRHIWELVLKRGWNDEFFTEETSHISELTHVTCVLLDTLKKRHVVTCVEAGRVASIILPALRRGRQEYVYREGKTSLCRRVGDEMYAYELFSKHFLHLDFLQDLILTKLFSDHRHKHDFCMLLRDVLMRRVGRMIGAAEDVVYRMTKWPSLEFDRILTETNTRFGLINTTNAENSKILPVTWCLELLLEIKTPSAAKIDMSMNQGVQPLVGKNGGVALVWLHSLETSNQLEKHDVGMRALYFTQALTQTSLRDMKTWRPCLTSLLEMYVKKCSNDVLSAMILASPSETNLMSLVKSTIHRLMMEYSKDSILPDIIVRFVLLCTKQSRFQDKIWRDLSRRGVLRLLDTAFGRGYNKIREVDSSSLVRTYADLLLLSSEELNACPHIYKHFVSQVQKHLFFGEKKSWNWDQVQIFERFVKGNNLLLGDIIPNITGISPLLLESEGLSSRARGVLMAASSSFSSKR